MKQARLSRIHMNFKPFFKSSQMEFKLISNYFLIHLDYPNNLATVQSVVKLPNLKDAENFDIQAGIYLKGITMLLRPGLVHSANDTAPLTEKMAYRPLALESRADKVTKALPLWSSGHFCFCSSPDFRDKTEVAYLAPTSQSNTTFSSPPVMEGLVTTDALATTVKLITTACGAEASMTVANLFH